jgi:hypothetical protein
MLKAIKSVLLSALMVPVLSVYSATISGKVTNRASGDPVQGAKVILGSAADADTATTNGQGNFSFTGVSTGFHSVVASLTGYQPSTSNVNVLQQNGSYTANITLLPSANGNTAGLVSGTVKDSVTKEAIKAATVILSHPAGRGGATPIDTVLTDGEGRFAFAAVPASDNYIVAVSAAGYVTMSNSNVDVHANDTVTASFLLVKQPVPSAALYGKVTDSTSKAAIAGAVVVLRKRVSTGQVATWQTLDSGHTGTDGSFSYLNLSAGTYSVLASKEDYVTKATVNVTLTNTQKDTVDVALARILKGSLSIFVGLDSTGNPGLSGAAVAASSVNGEVYTGTTDSRGWIVFPTVLAGSYSVSANLTGFVSKSVTRAVSTDEKDSGYVYLARATAQNSKSLTGLVRDGDGKAVSGAKVIFTATGFNGIVLFSTSSATGDYAFNGIPSTVAGGTVEVQKDGFVEFSGTVTLSGAASFLNVTLKLPVSIFFSNHAAAKLRLVRNGNGLSLEFPASVKSGSLALYDARGTLVEAVRVPAGAMRADLSAASRISGARFLVLTQGATAQRLAVPAVR